MAGAAQVGFVLPSLYQLEGSWFGIGVTLGTVLAGAVCPTNPAQPP